MSISPFIYLHPLAVQPIMLNGDPLLDSRDFDQGSSAEPLADELSEASWATRDLRISFEGDTEASTVSYLSTVTVHRAIQEGGYIVEIPARELDDPPDRLEVAAASHSNDEIELIAP